MSFGSVALFARVPLCEPALARLNFAPGSQVTIELDLLTRSRTQRHYPRERERESVMRVSSFNSEQKA